jgi:hypothetical protein
MWAAGFFQGSGTIGFYRARGTRILRSVITLTRPAEKDDPEALTRFQACVDNRGNIVGPRRYGDGRAKWTWTASNVEAAEVIELFLPYLRDKKREQAVRALDAFLQSRLSNQQAEAWAAGLFQKKGSSGFYRSNTSRVLRVQMQLTSDSSERRPLALEQFYRALSRAGHLHDASEYRKSGRFAWAWVALNAQGERALGILLPHLFDDKRDTAEAALASYQAWRATASRPRRTRE